MNTKNNNEMKTNENYLLSDLSDQDIDNLVKKFYESDETDLTIKDGNGNIDFIITKF